MLKDLKISYYDIKLALGRYIIRYLSSTNNEPLSYDLELIYCLFQDNYLWNESQAKNLEKW